MCPPAGMGHGHFVIFRAGVKPELQTRREAQLLSACSVLWVSHAVGLKPKCDKTDA